eukprot:36170_1
MASKQTGKRKRSESSDKDAVSSQPKKKQKKAVNEEALPLEQRRLIHVLKNVDGASKKLHDYVLESMHQKEVDEVIQKLLSGVFPKDEFKLPEKAHCARCHQEFDANNPKKRRVQNTSSNELEFSNNGRFFIGNGLLWIPMVHR